MAEQTDKLIHAFSALADLGAEITESRDFEEMVRSTLHVVLGAVGLRRGLVAEYEHDTEQLRFVAAWGMGDDAPAFAPFDAGRAKMLCAGNGLLSLSEAQTRPALQQQLGADLTATLLGLRVALVA
ncbi:MAG TPA: hypothetical protein VE821_13850, partial [Pyrinomonadaceae bacterium]|nr:hypothetical protein [Pyrinomonadaceae bacterium]